MACKILGAYINTYRAFLLIGTFMYSNSRHTCNIIVLQQ